MDGLTRGMQPTGSAGESRHFIRCTLLEDLEQGGSAMASVDWYHPGEGWSASGETVEIHESTDADEFETVAADTVVFAIWHRQSRLYLHFKPLCQ